MSDGDLSVRVDMDNKDEIGELANQFNQMAEQIQTSFNQVADERDTLKRFITDASHELRTPLTALKNFNELMQSTAAEDPEARSEFLIESQNQINRLAWITQNLLDISRLEAGISPIEFKKEDLTVLIETATQAFNKPLAEKSILLEIILPKQPVWIRCDRNRIEIAISNLLDNAVKYTPYGGTIEVGVESFSDRVEIWMNDTGSGIDSSDLPHIFERFYRGKNHVSEGSGLGLSIVEGIIQAHGWSININSLTGKGTRVLISIPEEN
jgi:signal transduction histidine kinase